MDLLKRQLAPVLPEAWEAIDDEARKVLQTLLAGRKLVDVDGPQGWQLAAVNLGRLDLFTQQPIPEVHVGKRDVLPLIEFRIPIRLKIMELDYVARGAKDPDLEPVGEAAQRAARLEDRAIFYGYAEAGIRGIVEASPHEPLRLDGPNPDYFVTVLQARKVLRESGIDGPYALAVGGDVTNSFYRATQGGMPIDKRLHDILGGPVVQAPALEGMVLLSTRGEDFILTVGQDLAIGYAHHDKDTVELYLTASFTFRVATPEAAVAVQSPTR